MQFAPLTRTKLSHQLFDALVAHIVTEGLQAGDSLPSTATLCEHFGASRSVVREALSALEAVGVVELASGRNAVVRDLDAHLITLFLSRAIRRESRPLAALMEVRVPLEVQCARLAAERADAPAVARIEDLLHQMDGALDDTHGYPVLDVAFHMEIARATGNSALTWFTDAIRAELMEVMVRVRSYREDRGLIGNEQEQHAEIARCIGAGDADGAVRAMTAHMTSSTGLVNAVEVGDQG